MTPEYQLLKNDSLTISEDDLRVMVIGDSYIHGGGIEFKYNFSQQLKKLLKFKNLIFKNIWVLDVSKSSSNNFDNNRTYFQFAEKFKPGIVILGYNLNDIDGNLVKKIDSLKSTKNFKKVKSSSDESLRLIKRIYNAIYKSHLVHYVLYKTHRKLNSFGIIIPNSNFDELINSYYENKENWQKSKELLNEIIEDSKQRDIQLIVYKFTETNLLEYPQLFSMADKVIESYFREKQTVIYLDGNEVLKGEKSNEYMLSKYDGHPNEKAHKKMAEYVFDTIIKSKNLKKY